MHQVTSSGDVKRAQKTPLDHLFAATEIATEIMSNEVPPRTVGRGHLIYLGCLSQIDYPVMNFFCQYGT